MAMNWSTECYLRAFTEFLKKKRLRLTRQRELIVSTFFMMSGHATLEELYRKLNDIDSSIGQSTVYRTMKLLVDSDLAHARHFNEAQALFEVAAQGEHHDHLVCTDCGTILEFEDPRIEELQREVARSFGFTIDHHRMELYGICEACSTSN